jgi:hypothetical protein
MLIHWGALPVVRNYELWSTLAETISYGNRQHLTSMFQSMKKRTSYEVKTRTPALLEHLKQRGDFYIAIKWFSFAFFILPLLIDFLVNARSFVRKFSSWIPFLTRLLPADVYHIW